MTWQHKNFKVSQEKLPDILNHYIQYHQTEMYLANCLHIGCEPICDNLNTQGIQYLSYIWKCSIRQMHTSHFQTFFPLLSDDVTVLSNISKSLASTAFKESIMFSKSTEAGPQLASSASSNNNYPLLLSNTSSWSALALFVSVKSFSCVLASNILLAKNFVKKCHALHGSFLLPC